MIKLIVFDWSGTLNEIASAFDFTSESTLFPDVKDTLQYLSDKGYHLAIATMLSKPELESELIQHDLGKYFTVTRTASECQSKPSPDMLEEIMDFCGVEASETLMVGDTHNDYHMARNAGTKVALVNAGELTQKADYPLNALSDLKEFL